MVQAALKKIGEAWEGLKARAEPVINFFKAVWGIITSAWSGDMEGMKNYALDALKAVKQYFQNTWNDIKGIVGRIVDWIKEKILGMLPERLQKWLMKNDVEKTNVILAMESGDTSQLNNDEKKEYNAREAARKRNQAAKDYYLQKKEIEDAAKLGKSHVDATAKNPIPANGSQKIDVHKENNVTVGETYVTINTTIPAEEIDRQIDARLRQGKAAYNHTATNFDDGVER